MKQATARFYYILVLCFILPSGNLFNIPIKMLLSVALMFSLIFLRNKILLDKIGGNIKIDSKYHKGTEVKIKIKVSEEKK